MYTIGCRVRYTSSFRRLGRCSQLKCMLFLYTKSTRPQLVHCPEEVTACATTVSYTHLRAHETRHDLVCRLLLEKIIVVTLNNVGHHEAYRFERFWTPCGVSYIVQFLHKDVFEAHIVQGGGPGHLCTRERKEL